MSIDLVIVRPVKGEGRTIGYVPRGAVEIGDVVITRFGEEEVVDTLYSYTEDDVFKFMKKNTILTPIYSVIKKLDYSKIGGDYDLQT